MSDFASLLSLLESSVSSSSITMTDTRRAVIIEALKIAIDSGKAVDALRPNRLPEATERFDLKRLTFSQRLRLKQLREGAVKMSSENAVKFPNDTLVAEGLIDIRPLDGEDAGLSLLTITNRGLAAR